MVLLRVSSQLSFRRDSYSLFYKNIAEIYFSATKKSNFIAFTFDSASRDLIRTFLSRWSSRLPLVMAKRSSTYVLCTLGYPLILSFSSMSDEPYSTHGQSQERVFPNGDI